VRACYDRLVAHVKALSGADDERINEFFRYGMWINVQAALGGTDLCERMEWNRENASPAGNRVA
jgi:hypothetical protein